jgi:hypothetical protein
MPNLRPRVTEVIPPPKMEDSEDFTAHDAESAEEASDSLRMVERIGYLCCPTCGTKLPPKGHALRRRGGIHYSRVKLQCEDGHEETRVFRLDWLKGDT